MNGSNEPRPPEVTYLDHEEFGARSAKTWDIPIEELHDGVGGAAEFVTVSTHSATHMDAPWHYGPTVAGEPSRKIDKVPLEWCYGDGVVLDLRHKNTGDWNHEEDIRSVSPRSITRSRRATSCSGRARASTATATIIPNSTPGIGIPATEYLLDSRRPRRRHRRLRLRQAIQLPVPSQGGKRESLMLCHHHPADSAIISRSNRSPTRRDPEAHASKFAVSRSREDASARGCARPR